MTKNTKKAAKTMKTMPLKQWESLKKTEKRLLLAQDTLKWLKDGRIKPQQGVFCDISFKNQKKNAKEAFESKRNICTVCAKGGFLYSRAMRINCIDLGEFQNAYDNDFDDTKNPMLDCFDRKQWTILEDHFEDHNLSGDVKESINSFCKLFNINSEKNATIVTLLFICLHIIHNKGKFMLPDTTEKQLAFYNKVVEPYMKETKEFSKLLQ